MIFVLYLVSAFCLDCDIDSVNGPIFPGVCATDLPFQPTLNCWTFFVSTSGADFYFVAAHNPAFVVGNWAAIEHNIQKQWRILEEFGGLFAVECHTLHLIDGPVTSGLQRRHRNVHEVVEACRDERCFCWRVAQLCNESGKELSACVEDTVQEADNVLDLLDPLE